MTIKEAHDYIRLLIPESDGRYFSPEQIDSAINMAVLDLFNQQYKMYEESQRISDTMARFNATVAFPVSAGLATITDDVAYITGLAATKIGADVTFIEAKFLADNFIASTGESEAFGPSEQRVFVVRFGSQLRVLPPSVTEITIAYLMLPTKAKFGYTVAGNGYTTIYNPGTSFQIDFVEQSHPEIVRKALRELGIAQKDQVLIQSEQIVKANNLPEMR